MGTRDDDATADLVDAFYGLQVQHAHVAQVIAAANGINPADLRMLKYLGQAEVAATPKDIGAYLQMGTGAVTAMIDRLEARDVVGRTQNPDDRRSVFIELRPVGRAVVARLRETYRDVLLDATEPDDRRALAAALERITAGLSGEPSVRD